MFILGMFSDSINSFKEFYDQYDNLIAFGEQYCEKKGIINGKQIKADEEIIDKLLKGTELSYRNIAGILEIQSASI